MSGQWRSMTFEELFSPETLKELRDLERDVIREEDAARQAQTELTARFLAMHRIAVAHIILDPSQNNVTVEFVDRSILHLGHVPVAEWADVVRCALHVAKEGELLLDCVDANTGACFVQFDRAGSLVPLHPKEACFVAY